MTLNRSIACLAKSMVLVAAHTVPAFVLRADPKKSEVVIVGTVHAETPSYKVDDLTAILKRIEPDVILCELDSSFFTKNFKFVSHFGDLEETAINAYQRIRPVELRPYDIEGRNQYYKDHNTFSIESEFYPLVSKLSDERKLDLVSQEILASVHLSFSKRDRWGKAGPRLMNSFECDKELAEKWYASDYGYSEIIRRTPELLKYKEFHRQTRDFELRRNHEMVKNIERLAHEFQGMRIVVFCGFEHRHFLKMDLILSKSPSFIVKEYWDYPETKAQ